MNNKRRASVICPYCKGNTINIIKRVLAAKMNAYFCDLVCYENFRKANIERKQKEVQG